MVDAVFDRFADAEHHGRGGPHAELVGSAMYQQPVRSQTFQTRDLVADFIVENFGTAARDRIESGVAQPGNRVPHAEVAVFGNRQDFRSRIAVEVNLREALLDAAQHLFMPVDLQVGMQSALHQHARAAEFDGLANFLVDSVQVENVAFLSSRSFQRTIEGAEGAIFRAEIRVVDVAVDDVGNGSLRMQLAAHRIRFHADPDQIIGAKHLQSLLLGQRHPSYSLVNTSKRYFNWSRAVAAS